MSTDVILNAGAAPDLIWKKLREFTDSARALSASENRLLESHAHQWVAVYHGEVALQADTFEGVIDKIDAEQLPRESVIIRYIDPEPRIMIL
jgi:hypothetical protein